MTLQHDVAKAVSVLYVYGMNEIPSPSLVNNLIMKLMVVLEKHKPSSFVFH
jgi:hypothetical protein